MAVALMVGISVNNTEQGKNGLCSGAGRNPGLSFYS
jgi:hypothetical protein